MSKVILEQTIECEYSRQVKLTMYDDGSLVVIGARQVNVVKLADQMDGRIADLAPDSSIAIIVRSDPGSIEAEMVRSGAPWMGMHENPKMAAHFFTLSEGTIKFSCRPTPPPVPIAGPRLKSVQG